MPGLLCRGQAQPVEFGQLTSAQPRSYELDAEATYTDATGQGSTTASTEVSTPYPSFTSMFNNAG